MGVGYGEEAEMFPVGGWVGGRVDWVDGCLLEWVEYVAPGSGELEVFPEYHVAFEDFSTAGCTGSRQVLKGPVEFLTIPF